MSYSSEIGRLLTARIEKFSTLNRHQLAGHAANLDFWLAEVRHCLEVIDGYRSRFERLKAAQTRYVSEHKTLEFDPRDPCCIQRPAPPPKRVADRELKETRRSLCDATYRFLVRCCNEGLINEPELQQACDGLGISIDRGDLRIRPGTEQ
jgi:hypothetical protein